MHLTLLPEHPCVYLPDRTARVEAGLIHQMLPQQYHALMDMGFRRSGQMIYRPKCEHCCECRQLRVDVTRFIMGKSHRRIWRRNQDLTIDIAEPAGTQEKFSLYERYLSDRHQSHEPPKFEDFIEFLYTSPTQTIEIIYRNISNKLIGIGICDLSQQSLSTVYFYFDPHESRRSLGTFSALYEIELARKLQIPWYYMGYWIAGSETMNYKANFKPHEVLENSNCWVRRC